MDFYYLLEIGERLAKYFVGCREGDRYAQLMHQLRMITTQTMLFRTLKDLLNLGQQLGKSIRLVGLTTADIEDLFLFLKKAKKSEVLHFRMHVTNCITEYELQQLQSIERRIVKLLEEPM